MVQRFLRTPSTFQTTLSYLPWRPRLSSTPHGHAKRNSKEVDAEDSGDSSDPLPDGSCSGLPGVDLGKCSMGLRGVSYSLGEIDKQFKKLGPSLANLLSTIESLPESHPPELLKVRQELEDQGFSKSVSIEPLYTPAPDGREIYIGLRISAFNGIRTQERYIFFPGTGSAE